MSNRRGNGDLASQGNQLTVGVAEMNLGPEQDDGGGWEVFGKKSKNKGGAASKPYAPQNPSSRTWGQGQSEVVQNTGTRNYNGSAGRGGTGRGYGSNRSAQPTDSRRPVGRGNPRPQGYNRGFEQSQYHNAPAPVARAALPHGWNWQGRAGNNGNQDSVEAEQTNDQDINDVHSEEEDDDDNDDDDAFDDSEDELFSDDEYDSGASKKSHSAVKKNKWFRKFFEFLDSLSLDQVNEPQRQWHCPACHGGPGAIDWYMGMQPLITHAKTVGATRVKLHRKFAEVLREELSLRGASVNPSGGMFGKWKGLVSEEKDYEIVWPPMVIIMNTQLDKDDNDKWTGMGNPELLEYFRSYEAAKARHSYGPKGHRGMSLLIFENSAKGYLEAERLHKHFLEEGRDRDAWDRRRKLFHASGGGQRQLYGYMAVKEDLDIFNQHSYGKQKLRFEMRSYQEMVVSQIKQMSEDNQRLLWYKNKAAKEQMHSKALEESFGQLTQKLKQTMEENIIVRERSKTHHEQNKEELEYQEQFFKEQIETIMKDRDATEEDFEKQQQEKRHNMEANAEESTLRSEEVIKLQDKEREEFEEEREKLIREQDEKMAAMKKRHGEEEVELEKEYNAALAKLMAKYSDPAPK